MEHALTDTIPACQICGHTSLLPVLQAKDHTVSSEHFQIMECASCSSWFTNPRPSANHIGAYYASEDYISHSDAHVSLVDRIYQTVRKRTLVSKGNLITQQTPSGSLLDVGCGTGQFMMHMRGLGYHVFGVEPDSAARQKATAISQATVYPGIDSVPPRTKFDVITLWHVLEHTPNVRLALEQIRTLLRPGGLLIIAIPDRESWDAQHYGSSWAAYDLPRHLNHLRRRDIRTLLRDYGMELLRVRPMWFDAYYICLLSESYLGRSKLASMLRGFLLGLWSNIVSLLSKRPTSSSLYVIRAAKGH